MPIFKILAVKTTRDVRKDEEGLSAEISSHRVASSNGHRYNPQTVPTAGNMAQRKKSVNAKEIEKTRLLRLTFNTATKRGNCELYRAF